MTIEDLTAYEVLKTEDLTGIHSKGTLLKHKKSGARVVLIENDDKNKVFSIGFRTPPGDSTGAPHIMEHSVLCGSKNFPAKDPFVELVKGSLNTFLNAMTYPDKTVFPIASTNDKDFQNLMHVYMDAVFYPNIYQHDEIFRQEGWSYELEDPDADLTINGVVYNEMKGAFSSPEGVLDRVVLNTLFPDTCYAYESGGDPEEIPNLTYEEFLDFHRTYYHPSNSYIYLYGDMDMAGKLDWLDREYLSKFDRTQVDSEIRLQPPFEEMRESVIPYSIASEESEEDNTYLSWNKVIGTSLDAKLCLAFDVLDYVLLSAPGACLKKALTEAGIGKDILGGYDCSTRQPVFSVVAKNANEEQKEKFVSVIEDTLEDLVRDGIDKTALEAAINYGEFRYREADYGSYPKGLMYGLEIMDSWLYDENEPFMHIDALDIYAFLKEKIGTSYYEDLIQEYLLTNTHGALVIVRPEKGRTARMDAELADQLAAYKDSLSAAEVEELVDATLELKEYQSAPEREEDLKKIPLLTREDLSREIEPILNEEMTLAGIPVLFHETQTNGIGYLDVLFDLAGIPEEKLPYVGILLSVLGMIDTENYDYGSLFNEINVHTGGISGCLETYSDVTRIPEKAFKATLEIRGKALYEKLPVVFSMMTEILTRSKLMDTDRIREILEMNKSQLLMGFNASGHTTAALRARSYDSPSARFRDLTEGIEFYRVLDGILAHYDEEKESLSDTLISLARQIFTPGRMMISYTAAREGLDGFETQIDGMKQALFADQALTPEGEDAAAMEQGLPCALHCEKKNEGFKTASKVQYVARAGNFIDHGASYTGALQILKVILSYDYLWQNIRVKGGAYGCMSGFSRTGEGYFVSYRDPHLKATLDVYDGVVEYLRNFTVSERDMTKYIIGTISNLDTPLTPSGKGQRSLNLYLGRISDEKIRQERDQVLDAEQDDIRALADVAQAMLDAGQLCVIGGEEKIEENAALFDTVTSF